jgi:hypothetical protein
MRDATRGTTPSLLFSMYRKPPETKPVTLERMSTSTRDPIQCPRPRENANMILLPARLGRRKKTSQLVCEPGAPEKEELEERSVLATERPPTRETKRDTPILPSLRRPNRERRSRDELQREWHRRHRGRIAVALATLARTGAQRSLRRAAKRRHGRSGCLPTTERRISHTYVQAFAARRVDQVV